VMTEGRFLWFHLAGAANAHSRHRRHRGAPNYHPYIRRYGILAVVRPARGRRRCWVRGGMARCAGPGSMPFPMVRYRQVDMPGVKLGGMQFRHRTVYHLLGIQAIDADRTTTVGR